MTSSQNPDSMSPGRSPLLVPAGSVALLLALASFLTFFQAVYVSHDSTPLAREFHNAPFVVTPTNIVDEMLRIGRVTQADIVYDLGCGDGRIVVAAAKKFGCRALGVDIDPERVAEARAAVQAAGVEHLVTIEQKDVFEVDLRGATVVMIYLLPHLNVGLIPQLQQLRPGSRIVCHDFGIDGYKPDESYEFLDEKEARHHVMFWEGPLPQERTAPLQYRYLPKRK